MRYRRNRYFSADALSLLESYDWPGNIRELSNLVERLVLLSPTQQISRQHLLDLWQGELNPRDPRLLSGAFVAPSLADRSSTAPPTGGDGVRPYEPVQPSMADQIRQALADQRGNQSRAAQQLGMMLRRLRYRMQQLGIG